MLKNSFIALGLLLICVHHVSSQDKDNKIPNDVQTRLDKGDQFELLSLNGERDKSKDSFHGWKVLGKSTMKDGKSRGEVVAALKKGVAENKSGPAFCFIPRHGIRVVHDGKTTDLLICFECSQVHVYTGDVLEYSIWTTDSPQGIFDMILKKAGVPLPKKQAK